MDTLQGQTYCFVENCFFYFSMSKLERVFTPNTGLIDIYKSKRLSNEFDPNDACNLSNLECFLTLFFPSFFFIEIKTTIPSDILLERPWDSLSYVCEDLARSWRSAWLESPNLLDHHHAFLEAEIRKNNMNSAHWLTYTCIMFKISYCFFFFHGE